VSRRRTTFGKLQRDRDKQAKQRAKEEKRHSRSEEPADDDEVVEAPAPIVDQGKVLDQLAKLHAAYDDGQMELDDFEARRAELTSLLHVD
jgi:hypothetical protein